MMNDDGKVYWISHIATFLLAELRRCSNGPLGIPRGIECDEDLIYMKSPKNSLPIDCHHSRQYNYWILLGRIIPYNH